MVPSLEAGGELVVVEGASSEVVASLASSLGMALAADMDHKVDHKDLALVALVVVVQTQTL